MQVREVTRYLALPLRTAPLLLIATFSALLVLAFQAGLIGIPLGWTLISWFFKYSFVLLDHTAEGVREPPALSVEMVNPISELRPLVLLLITIGLYYLSDAAIFWFGSGIALAIEIAGLLILPAIIAVQGATGSVLQSLHPLIVIGLIARLRHDYLLILIGIAIACAIARALVITDLLPLILRIAFTMYEWLAIYALIGGVVFERRHDLGFDPAHSPERVAGKLEAERDRQRDLQIDRIYAEWRGGSRINAWQTIMQQIETSSDPIGELRWIYKRAALWLDGALADRLAIELLPRLLAARQSGIAVAIIRARIDRDANFRPRRSADLVELVRLSRDAGYPRTARTLLQEFERFYPDDELRRAAQHLTEELQR
jgi:hypothetical protein